MNAATITNTIKTTLANAVRGLKGDPEFVVMFCGGAINVSTSKANLEGKIRDVMRDASTRFTGTTRYEADEDMPATITMSFEF